MEQRFSSTVIRTNLSWRPLCRFGYGFSCSDDDFAGVLPLAKHALLVNMIEEIEPAIKLMKWWMNDSILAEKMNYLMKTDVIKCGISSRKTTGKVIDVEYNHIYVFGNEVTPFAIPGDSGSLVLNQEGEVLGVVMEIT